MSSGTYHRRWASAGAGGSAGSVQQNRTITSGIEPHTYGTSWNSVRWNKLLEGGGNGGGGGSNGGGGASGSGGGHWSRFMSTLESTSKGYSTGSSYSTSPGGRFGSQPATRNNIELRNSGPSVVERAAPFGGSVLSLMRDTTPNRTSPRLPWLSDPSAYRRGTAYNNFPRNSRENAFTADSRRTPSSSSSARPYESAVRHAAFSSAVASTSLHDRSYLNNAPQAVSSNYISPTLRAERPWRQRMADAARLRSAHGDEIGGAIQSTLAVARARRSSISNQRNGNNSNGEELQSSLNALKNFMEDRTAGLSPFRRNGRLSSRQSPSMFADKSSRDSSVMPTYRYTPIPGTYPSRWNTIRSREYMSRSYSPIRPRPSAPNAVLSRYNSLSTDLLPRPLRSLWQSSTNSLYENAKIHVLGQQVLNSPIPESSRERESSRRLLSSKERTLRHRSRQRSQDVAAESDSSSGTEQRAQSREKRLRKRLRKKSTEKGKSVDKGPAASAAEKVVKTDKKDEIREDGGQNEQLRNTQTQDNSEIASSMATSPLYNKGPELFVPIQCDEGEKIKATEEKVLESTEQVKQKQEMGNLLNKAQDAAKCGKKEKEKPKKGLFSFIKKKKTTDKTDNKTNTDNKKESKKAAAEKKKGDKESEWRDTSAKQPKMLEINVQVADEVSKLSPDQLAPHFVSPTSPSSLSSSHRNAVTGTSADDLSEANEHYGAVARFNPSGRVTSSKSKSKSPAPVPGTWSGPEHHEMNISQNKHLQRHEACSNAKVVAIITKTKIFCTIPPLTLSAPEPKPRKPVEIALIRAFRSLHESNEKISFSRKCPRLVKMDKKVQEPKVVTAKFAASFASRTRSVQDTRKTIKAKRRENRKCSVTVKEPSIRLIALRESMSKKANEQNSCRAEVTVLTSPVAGVNFYRCRRRVRATHSKIRSMPKESTSRQISAAKDQNDTQSATLPLNSLQNKKDVSKDVDGSSHQLQPLRDSVDEDLSERGELILPDRSLLEEYVKRKREKLERLHSEPLELGMPDSRESPCLSSASEFMQACAVRVLEPTREVPYITAPSRSRLGSVEVETVSTPTAKVSAAANSRMLDILSHGEQMLTASYHGLKGSPVGRSERSTSLTRPTFEFDAPMSPFEQKLQNQAFQLRKVSAYSEGDTPIVQDTPTVDVTMQLPVRDPNRRLPTEGTSITTNFTAAAAAAAQPRHERYAAHIPVNRGDGSGRQSVASVDSNNSGALETATRQLDQMIDQARYRHHQHRSKFKEAIDYLDQIFEDLKKEGDQSEESQRSHAAPVVPIRKGPVNSIKEQQQQQQQKQIPVVKLRSQNGAKRSVLNGGSTEQLGPRQASAAAATNRHSLHTTKPKLVEKYYQQEKPASFEQTSEDVDVSETVVLPPPPDHRKLKGERMDFTRRWLAGDIKSWAAVQPKPDLLLGGLEEEPDVDERSLGSCSAEVAAINSAVRKKKKARDMPDLIQNVASTGKYVRCPTAHQVDPSVRKGTGDQYTQQSGPIKPQPVKAQVTYPFPSSSTGNLNNFNNYPQPFRDDNVWANGYDDANGNQYPLQRVSSHSRVPEKKHSGDSVSWRSTSQDPYNTLSSVRSADVQLSAQKTGAFTPVQPPNIVTMRGSVASLPESSIIRPQPLRNADPALTIDALVAELELNTDQTTTANKRRSFPTGIEFSVRHEYEQPISSRQLVQSSAQEPARTKSERNTRRQQQQPPQKPKAAFDEMANMLHNVASDMAPNETPKGRKYEQVAAKSSTMLSPFETINQEKLNPSKVGALQSMFEKKQHAPVWRRSIPSNNCYVQPAVTVKDDDNYYEINDFGTHRKEISHTYAKPTTGKQSSPPVHSTFQQQRHVPPPPAPSQHEFIPAFPVTQPPSHPPGSTNSSQTGGYYSSGSSLGAPSSYASHNNHSSLPRSPGRRGSLVGKQSASSRAASFEDEDDGFYDNIQIDEKRFSRGSELDSVSIGSHRLPPVVASKPAGNRLGQFLRKISSSKPPGNAASLVSLNKVASEIMPTKPIPLMKSNSLSHDPWKKHVIQNAGSSPQRAVADKRGGLGQRLKNSIFGSKKRLN